jgi:hypothetical protein
MHSLLTADLDFGLLGFAGAMMLMTDGVEMNTTTG